MKRYACLVVLVVIVVLAGCRSITEMMQGAAIDTEAVASFVQGTVAVFTKGGAEGRPLGKGDKISSGQDVVVDGNSRVEISFPDGSVMRLSEKTRLAINKVLVDKQTGKIDIRAFLHLGKLWSKVKKLSTPDSRFNVATSAAIAGVKGTVFRVDVGDDKTSRIKVYEGAVAVSKATGTETQPVMVTVSQEIAVSAEGISSPEKFDPASEVDGWTRWNQTRDAGPEILSITMTPAGASLQQGQTQRFTALATFSDDKVKDITAFASWSSSDPDVVVSDSGGLVTGSGTGSAAISASLGGKSGATLVNVGRELVSIKVAPSGGAIAPGQPRQFTATGTFSDKTTMDITEYASWNSSDASVASINAGGLASGGQVTGTATITASLLGESGSATLKLAQGLLSITVTPAAASVFGGSIRQFRALANYPGDVTRDVTDSARWRISNPKVGVIDKKGLALTSLGMGLATITASYEGMEGSAGLIVAEHTLASLAVNPADASISQAGSTQFRATGTYTDGSTGDLTSVVDWRSEAATVAAVNSTGLASGLAPGSTRITAAFKGKAGTARVSVPEQ